ncbi:hypothetical protein [Streptomyces phytophilus]|uniref:hypothetical protein n=1 Tax=Streptomyces phytophilus TaxID=722715 RepID=UPI0015F09B40|nr:hypothetical protein [Streptomyces phytophilus]
MPLRRALVPITVSFAFAAAGAAIGGMWVESDSPGLGPAVVVTGDDGQRPKARETPRRASAPLSSLSSPPAAATSSPAASATPHATSSAATARDRGGVSVTTRPPPHSGSTSPHPELIGGAWQGDDDGEDDGRDDDDGGEWG